MVVLQLSSPAITVGAKVTSAEERKIDKERRKREKPSCALYTIRLAETREVGKLEMRIILFKCTKLFTELGLTN